MKRICLFICMLLCLTACHDDNNGEWTPPNTASRSVMIYMSGENNLTESEGERFLQNDLKEMIEGSKLLSNDQRLFIFVDSLNTNKKRAGKPYIIEVHDGKAIPRYEFEEEFYASDPAYFHKIMDWMVTNAKANSYGLVLWGHACGWVTCNDTIAQSRSTRAYGQDNGTDAGGSLKWMNITQMAKALEGLPKLKFIFCDCCDMMCAEIGYELRHATDYVIGSPAEIPGEGAPYHEVIPYLYKDGSEMYRGIIDTYFDYYLADFEGDKDLDGHSVPLSVIDTKYMERLAQETHDILGTFMPDAPKAPNLKNLAFYWFFDYSPVMYDMMAFIKTNAPESNYQQWEQVYKQAVPYYRMSMKWLTIYGDLVDAFPLFNQDKSLYGCVSMHIPLNLWAYTGGTFRFNANSINYEWNRIMDWSRFGW